jgi:hypothetical protein
VAELEEHLGALISAGLIDEVDGALRPHGWDSRQFESDTSRDRMRRARHPRPSPVTSQPAHTDRHSDGECDVTSRARGFQNRTDTEAEQKQSREPAAPAYQPDPTGRLPHHDDPDVIEADDAYAVEMALKLAADNGVQAPLAKAAIAEVKRRVSRGDMQPVRNLGAYIVRMCQSGSIAGRPNDKDSLLERMRRFADPPEVSDAVA